MATLLIGVGMRGMGIRFFNTVDAWEGTSQVVAFAGEDDETELAVVCAITRVALINQFGADARNVAELVRTFRENRALIEKVASDKYDRRGRTGPIILQLKDFDDDGAAAS